MSAGVGAGRQSRVGGELGGLGGLMGVATTLAACDGGYAGAKAGDGLGSFRFGNRAKCSSRVDGGRLRRGVPR